jgi:putative spermidine/putrescine transport system ATP-binding protein
MMIRLRNVADARSGLIDVSLDVAEGEVVSLLGAGAANLLLILAGLARQTGGEVVIDGRLLRRTPPHQRNLGMVFAAGNLFPQLSVAANLALALRGRGLKRAERAASIADMLAMFDLETVARRRPGSLSILQRRQAALARATIFDPAVLLLDEPFADLDPQPRAALRQRLLEVIHGNQLTVLLATSEWQDAMALSDRIGVLADGAIVQIGPPQELYERPAHRVVARMMGETNSLPGTLREIDDDSAMVALACGPVVQAVPGEKLDIGQRCVVHVRPERIAIAAANAEELGPHAIQARLQHVTQFGDHIRLEVSIGTARLIIRRPAGASTAGLWPGALVAVAWQSAHASVFTAIPLATVGPFR